MWDQQRLRPACAYAQSDQSLCSSLDYSMIVKLLTEHHLEFLSFKGGCTGSIDSTPVKMPHCWKSHVTAHLFFFRNRISDTRVCSEVSSDESGGTTTSSSSQCSSNGGSYSRRHDPCSCSCPTTTGASTNIKRTTYSHSVLHVVKYV